ncbi:MAG: universal stress protein, partial [Actinobacteria bacterium]|nr:universal stress protein [Actinomycetota bacterium]
MNPILFATDGSPSAAAAQTEAFELAKLMEAPLVVVSVVHPVLPTVGYSAYGYSNLVAELADAEKHRVEDLLRHVGDAAKELGIACTTVAASGPTVDAIVAVAEERHARMLVVGSHGWGLGGRFVHGSVSTALLHAAPCPVLVVRSPEHAG